MIQSEVGMHVVLFVCVRTHARGCIIFISHSNFQWNFSLYLQGTFVQLHGKAIPIPTHSSTSSSPRKRFSAYLRKNSYFLSFFLTEKSPTKPQKSRSAEKGILFPRYYAELVLHKHAIKVNIPAVHLEPSSPYRILILLD